MRERAFVERNKEKWARFEAFTEGRSELGPEELSDLYAGITDDLSYARTYYPRRSIRVYLNNIARNVYLNLYRSRSAKGNALLKFFTHDLPAALYRARRELNISLIFFIVSMAIGVFSSVHDPDFAEVILGEDYVRMTEENIRRGDPMGVYKSSGETEMFLAITLNNLLVAFRTFVLGAFFGVGTLIIMLYNGIMVGTFQYFFVERALFGESFLTIWMHGALEISALVISGGAGLTMGRGLLFPGNLPRMQSFQIAARRAFRIMLGLVPVFVAAAFIEGFFTRITELPDYLRGGFIFACFAFVGLYFWWYPRALYGKSGDSEVTEDELISPLSTPFTLRAIRKTSEIFTAAFHLFRLNFVRTAGTAAALAAVYTAAFYLIYGAEGTDEIDFTKVALFNLRQFHDYSVFFFNFFLNIFLLTAVVWTSLRYFGKTFGEKAGEKFSAGGRTFLKVAVIVTLFELCILSGNIIVASLGLAAVPYLLLFAVTATAENLNLPDAFNRMLNLLRGTRRQVFGTYLSLALIAVLILFLMDSPLTWFYLDVAQWNLDMSEDAKIRLALLSLLFVNQAGTALVIPLLVNGQICEYYAALESRDAVELGKDVEAIGVKRKAYGLERE